MNSSIKIVIKNAMKLYTVIKVVIFNLHFNNGGFPNNNPEYANEIHADISGILQL